MKGENGKMYVSCETVLRSLWFCLAGEVQIQIKRKLTGQDVSSGFLPLLRHDISLKWVRIFGFNLLLVIYTQHHLEERAVDGRIILKFIFRNFAGGGGGMDWFDLTQDRDRWQARVNAVMNFQVPFNARNFFTGWEPVIILKRTLIRGLSKLVSK